MISLVILAAGWGSRYGGLKQVAGFGPKNESILDYSVFDAYRVGIKDLLLVISKDLVPTIEKKFNTDFYKQITCDYVIQKTSDVPINIDYNQRKKPWGTAHALYSARHKLKNPFALINADDFYGLSSFQILYKELLRSPINSNKCCLIGFKLKNCLSENGPVSRGICQTSEGKLIRITENFGLQQHSPTKIIDAKGIFHSAEEIVSMNCWGFNPQIFDWIEQQLKSFLPNIQDIEKEEFMLPSVIEQAIIQQNMKATVFLSKAKPFGVTYKADKQLVSELIKQLHLQGNYPPNLLNDFSANETRKQNTTSYLRRNSRY